MYHIRYEIQSEQSEDDYFTTKRAMVSWLSEKVQEPQRHLNTEIDAKNDSVIYRDSQGWRALIWYTR